jgi:hypothetical protein
LLAHSEQLKIADTVSWPEDIHKPFLLSYLRLEVNRVLPHKCSYQFPAKNAEAGHEMFHLLINLSVSWLTIKVSWDFDFGLL